MNNEFEVHVSDVIRDFEDRVSCEWSTISSAQKLKRPSLGSGTKLRHMYDPSLKLTRGKTRSCPPPPPMKPPARNKIASRFRTQSGGSIVYPPSPQSLVPQPKTFTDSRALCNIQCDFCGTGNSTNVHSCANCGNPRSARWMKITQEQVALKQPFKSDMLSGPAPIKWKEGASAPVCSGYHNAILYKGKIYIGGGNDCGLTKPSHRIDIYDPKENCWSPSPINVPYHWFAMTFFDSQLMIVGGKDRCSYVTNRIFLLDNNNQLKYYTKMITPRCLATAVSHLQNLLVAGGKDNDQQPLASTEVFDIISGQWYATGDLPSPLCSLQATIADNTIYLLGGGSQDSSSSKVYTTSLGMLSSKKIKWNSDLSTPWNRSFPVSTQGKELLVVGGRKKIGVYFYLHTSDIYVLNKLNHSWKVIEQIPSPRVAPVVVSMSDTIIVIGGVDEDGQFTNTVWIGSREPQKLACM